MKKLILLLIILLLIFSCATTSDKEPQKNEPSCTIVSKIPGGGMMTLLNWSIDECKEWIKEDRKFWKEIIDEERSKKTGI